MMQALRCLEYNILARLFGYSWYRVSKILCDFTALLAIIFSMDYLPGYYILAMHEYMDVGKSMKDTGSRADTYTESAITYRWQQRGMIIRTMGGLIAFMDMMGVCILGCWLLSILYFSTCCIIIFYYHIICLLQQTHL